MHICLVYAQTPKPYTFGRFLYALLAWEMCKRTFETPCTVGCRIEGFVVNGAIVTVLIPRPFGRTERNPRM